MADRENAPVAFLVTLSWPDNPEYNNDTPEQVAAIRDAIECLCGVESVADLLDIRPSLAVWTWPASSAAMTPETSFKPGDC